MTEPILATIFVVPASTTHFRRLYCRIEGRGFTKDEVSFLSPRRRVSICIYILSIVLRKAAKGRKKQKDLPGGEGLYRRVSVPHCEEVALPPAWTFFTAGNCLTA